MTTAFVCHEKYFWHDTGNAGIFNAVLEELSGAEARIEDSFAAIIEQMGGHQLYPHQEAVIEAAAQLAASVRPAPVPAAV